MSNAAVQSNTQSMEAKYVNAFLQGTIHTLKVQCSYEVAPAKSFLVDPNADLSFDIAGVIGLTSSAFCGAITIAMPSKMFLAVMGSMFGETYSEITDELSDGVAELMNIIFGSAKTTLTNDGLSVDKAIPTVIRGNDLKITSVTSGGSSIAIPFNGKDGTFHVLVSLGKSKPGLKAVNTK